MNCQFRHVGHDDDLGKAAQISSYPYQKEPAKMEGCVKEADEEISHEGHIQTRFFIFLTRDMIKFHQGQQKYSSCSSLASLLFFLLPF